MRISRNFATGAVTGGQQTADGGFVGLIDCENGPPCPTAIDTYSTGSPTGGTISLVGGFVGNDGSDGSGISYAYWDMSTSGISDPGQGAGNTPNDPGITGFTTAQLQSGLPDGFDPSVWAESSTVNDGLPYLSANPPR